MRYPVIICITLAAMLAFEGHAATGFRVTPYLQNPQSDAVSLLWISETNTVGQVSYYCLNGPTNLASSIFLLASNLAYHSSEYGDFPSNVPPSIPYMHRVRLTNLMAGAWYDYSVVQDTDIYTNRFKPPPRGLVPIRFVVYGDAETEPESTGAFRK